MSGLAELNTAEQAYVAAGQGEDFWFQKATALIQDLGTGVTSLRQMVRTPEAAGELESVVEQLGSLGQLDERARDLIRSGQRLSGSDLVFTEGAQSIGRISILVNEARAKELAARSAAEAAFRRIESYFAGGAAGIALLAVIVLLPIPRKASQEAEEAVATDVGSGLGLSRVEPAPKAAPASQPPANPFAMPPPSLGDAADLGGTARLCSSLARVREMTELPALLEQAAKLMDASGLIVWVAEKPGGELRPAVAHGYSASVLARLGIIKAEADNATAVAYRTGTLQAVGGDALTNGALVVPLATSVGVAGALAAELRHGRENDAATQSLATIVAAQLSTLFTPAT